jgi:hypothetical protein
MRRHLRLSLVFAALALAMLLIPVTASATPPPNDDFNNATVITGLPFSNSVDMSEATVAPDDPLPSCADPAIGNGPGTVWYSLTLNHDAGIVYNAFGSSYEPGIVVYTGSRGALTEVQCSGGFFGTPLLNAAANVTYYFMIQNFNGQLVFNANEVQGPQPPATIKVSIDKTGDVAKSGVATIAGTVTCSRDATAAVDLDLTQVFAGRLVAHGVGSVFSTSCSTAGSRWSVSLQSGTAVRFGGGRANAVASATTCGDVACNNVMSSAAVTLRRH